MTTPGPNPTTTIHASASQWVLGRMIWPLAILGVIAPLALTLNMWARLAVYPFDWDPSEGDNILWASEIAQGKSSYGDFAQYPMTGNCYPPLYHAIVAPLVRAAGREVTAGRFVSMIASALTGVVIALGVRVLTGNPVAGILAGLVFLASPVTRLWGGLARIDSLLTLLSLASFLLLAAAQPTMRRALLGTLLGVAAVYTKQYGAVFVLAGWLLLLRHDRHKALAAALLGAVLGIAVLVALQRWSNGWYWNNTFTANATEFLWDKLTMMQSVFLVQHGLLGAAAIVGVVFVKPAHRVTLIALLVAGFVASSFVGKAGGELNYHVPLVAAMALAMGCAIAGAMRPDDAATGLTTSELAARRWLPFCLALSVGAQSLFWLDKKDALPPEPEHAQAMAAAASLLRDAAEPILVERHATLQYKAGHATLWEPCLLHYMEGAKLWKPDTVARDLQEQRFGAVVTSGSFFSTQLQDALLQGYGAPARTIVLADWRGMHNYALFVKRTPTATQKHTP